jgi:archaellum biogenesis ATPase FlaH
VRQGNENPEMDICTYVTESTFDSYLYQMVEAKQNIEKELQSAETQLSNYEAQLASAKVEVEKPFPQEDKLKTKSARLDELNVLLNLDRRENEIVGGERDSEDDAPARESADRER